MCCPLTCWLPPHLGIVGRVCPHSSQAGGNGSWEAGLVCLDLAGVCGGGPWHVAGGGPWHVAGAGVGYVQGSTLCIPVL